MGTPNIDLIILISKSLKMNIMHFLVYTEGFQYEKTWQMIIIFLFSEVIHEKMEHFWKTENSFKENTVLPLILIFLYVFKNEKWRWTHSAKLIFFKIFNFIFVFELCIVKDASPYGERGYVFFLLTEIRYIIFNENI